MHNKEGAPILHGTRETTGARLWRINITPTTVQTGSALTATSSAQRNANRRTLHARAYDLPSIPALITYLHATAGYPVKGTWLAAIKRGAYASWPGLTYTSAARYCPDADETHKGHMAQPRQNIRSTKQAPTPPTPTGMPDAPAADPAANTVEIHELAINRIFTNDTGRFHPRSRSGNQYIMVALHARSNAILIRPFASKSDTHRIAAYKDVYTRLATVNQAPALHILDNEASAAFQQAITTNACQFQLVPPHVHRRNAAERAIRTFKDHFLATLAGVAPNFPADRWDLLLPQAELTLNLLRPSPNTPATSAWEALFGAYNFDATPMGPAGSNVIIHTKPTLRRSWDYRGQDGFNVGPALSHYRCYRVLTKESRAVIISDAIRFRHHRLPNPNPTLQDKILTALHAIDASLTGLPPAPTEVQLAAIESLRTVLRDVTPERLGLTPPPPGVGPIPPPGVGPPGVGQAPPPGADETPTGNTDNAWTTIPIRAHRQPVPPPQPIAARTRSRTGNAFALLAHDDNDHNDNPTTPTYAPLATPVLDTASGDMLEHRHKQTWDTSYSNELGRLCQGVGVNPAQPTEKRVNGTDTFRPIHMHNIPRDRRGDVTYTRVVCEVRPQKAEPNRTRITIGGNRICYPGDTGTKTGSLELVKLLLNSTLSMPHARFACYDIANFYLGTPLDRPEYVRIKLTDIPQEFSDEYNLTQYATDGWIYFEINKGVYGLKQAGKLANDLLTERLAEHGYYQCPATPGLWRHKWRPVTFVLIVDDFGIQYVDKRHAEHLLNALQHNYTVTTDWTGAKFAGINMAWDYVKRTCRLSMTEYINDVLVKYNHPQPPKPQHAPHAHRAITYGAKEQLLPDDDTSPPLDTAGIKRIQGIIGSLLYYARAVDNKLLATLSAISSQQAKATENTAKAVSQLLDYVATYPNDGVTYRASAMVLAAHSDASFLTEPGSRSRAGAHIFLTEEDPIPRTNGPVLTLSQIIKFVMASAAEAELAALYITAREMIPLRNALDEMGWKQPKSPIQTDNSTATGFIHDTIIQRRIKMIWMRLHWLRCRSAQGQFRFYWEKGSANLADYHTKHHPPAYHIAHRPTHAG